MSAEPATRASLAREAIGAGAIFAALTVVTHTANFGFTVVAGRLLSSEDFATLTALLGVVLLGMAPGMAFQALTAASVLGQPVVVDTPTARRLALVIGTVVTVLLVALWPVLELDSVLQVVAIAVAAGLLPLTASNEGLLQGRGQFVALGTVMVVGAATKLSFGTAGMWATGVVGPATVAIALGYAAQLLVSRRRAGRLPVRGATSGNPAMILSAVALVGLLLSSVHADAVLAQAVLEGDEAGRYAVGVMAARITFWLPQFAMLLLFPVLVRDHRSRVVTGAMVGIAGLGLAVGLASRVVGEPLVAALYGERLASIGPDLWRFVWLGAANLGLQVLVLSDLARGRRRSAVPLGAALITASAALAVVRPSHAPGVITIVATTFSLAMAAGIAHRLMSDATSPPATTA